ncbi:hypothetical protein BGZ68_003886 [Mortierella alpina]|nr:hypothetical protein BGZ68_003886 [Mortierella alpina]
MASSRPSAQTVTNPASQQCTDPSIAQCTNLKRVKIAFDCYQRRFEDPSLRSLTTLLYNNRDSLTHLELQLDGIEDKVALPVVLSVSTLIHLQHLTFRSKYHSEAWVMVFLRACLPLPRLSELYCHFFIRASDLSPAGDIEVSYEDKDYYSLANPTPELKAILDTAIAARTSVSGSINVKIKALRFPDPDRDNIDLIRLVLPILRSDLVQVETLEVPKFLDHRTKQLYDGIILNHCVALRHLILPSFVENSRISNIFIRAASGLKTVRGYCVRDDADWQPGTMMRWLAVHQSKTLEEVELMICRMIESRDLQALLIHCEQLKRFWMVPDTCTLTVQGIEFRHIITGAWKCLGMRELSLTLNRSIDVKTTLEAMREDSLNKCTGNGDLEVDELYRSGDKEQERKATAWAAKQAFAQIGRLTALEYLALGTDEGICGPDNRISDSMWDLTLSKGYLAELAGLKNLRHLHMKSDHWSRMGQAEVEFMYTHWPLLDCVTFDKARMGLLQLLKEIDLPHWQWLQRKRSSLRLSTMDLSPG